MRLLFAIAAPIALGLLLGVGADAVVRQEAQRLALLVGCSSYPHLDHKDLHGPAHDVKLWRRLLTTKFGFKAEQVVTLAEAEAPTRLPTRANIAAAFVKLAADASPGAQVFISLSGHGAQVPIPNEQKDPLDPANPEPDGLDEIFLPRDYAEAEGRKKNFIRDNEIGAWLDAIRAKGADVFIVFDCCHSGTMARGPAEGEVSRGLDAVRDLGFAKEEMEATARRAAAAVRQAVLAGRDPEKEAKQKLTRGKGQGQLVAMFAAQPHETAPDLPRPQGAAIEPENYHGLLSYTLLGLLERNPQSLSYRDLTQLALGAYRAERGSYSPTPSFEASSPEALERQVLGATELPPIPEILLQKPARPDLPFRLNAGSLRGLSAGSVLSVHSPTSGVAEQALGYVRVETVTPLSAQVLSCGAEGEPADLRAELPNRAHCRPIRVDLGDLRVPVRLDGEIILLKETAELKQMVRWTEEGKEAEWMLCRRTPEEAKRQYGIELPKPAVLLANIHGRVLDGTSAAPRSAEIGKERRIYAIYPQEDLKSLSQAVERDLKRIFRWRNLWRVAHAAGGARTRGVTLSVSRLPNVHDDGLGEPLTESALPHDAAVRVRLQNSGGVDCKVTAFHLSAAFEIRLLGEFALGANRDLVWKLRLNAGPHLADTGPEGLVVLVQPEHDEAEMRFAHLRQPPLGESSAVEEGTPHRGPVTPFQRFLSHAAFGAPASRGALEPQPSDPEMLFFSYLLVPR